MPTAREIQQALLPLGRVFSEPPAGLESVAGDYRETFEEFVREHEFDLALHAVCDYLLEALPVFDSAIVDQIRQLHVTLQLDDHCAITLGRVNSGNI